MELVEEAELHRDVYTYATKYLKYPANAQIKGIFIEHFYLFYSSFFLFYFILFFFILAIPLIESLPAVYIMDELLFALGPFAGGYFFFFCFCLFHIFYFYHFCFFFFVSID